MWGLCTLFLAMSARDEKGKRVGKQHLAVLEHFENVFFKFHITSGSACSSEGSILGHTRGFPCHSGLGDPG